MLNDLYSCLFKKALFLKVYFVDGPALRLVSISLSSILYIDHYLIFDTAEYF